MNSDNMGVALIPNGWLHINEGQRTSDLKTLSDIPINSVQTYHEMNIEVDESTQPPTITSTPNYNVNFELGKIVKDTKLKGRISIYGADRSGTQLATLNMASIGYTLNPGFVNYMNETFLYYLCNTGRSEVLGYEVFVCPANGKEVPGMPGIIIESRTDGRHYELSSSDYFIYPTVKKYTQAAKAIYGVHL